MVDFTSVEKFKFSREGDGRMKKMLTAAVALALLSGGLLAQDAMDNGSGRSERGTRPRMGERGNRQDRGNRQERPDRMGPMMNGGRAQAEAELQKKAPEKFAELVKEREALEAKFQALAKANDVKLPMTQEARAAKIAEFNKKHEKELAEIRQEMRTDREGAMKKLRALYEQEGLEMMPMFGMRERTEKPDSKENAGPRENPQARMREEIKKAYPEEFAKLEELRKKDPAAFRDAFRKLAAKYRAEHQAKDGNQPPAPKD